MLKIDHSMKSAFQNCPTYGFLRYVCGLTPILPDTAGGRDFGKAMHLGTETLDAGQSIDAAVDVVVEAFGPREDRVRTPDRARALLQAYHSWRDREGVEFAGPPEVSFEMALTDHIIHCGRFDRIMVNGWPMDLKFPYYLYDSSGSPEKYFDQWIGHNALRGYAAPWNAPGVRIVGLGVALQREKAEKRGAGNPLPTLQYRDIPVFDWELDLWRKQVLAFGEDLMQLLEAQELDPTLEDPWGNLTRAIEQNLFVFWPQNTGSCYSYNSRCMFKDLCVRNYPQGLIEQQYEITVWKPYMSLDIEPETF